MQYIFLFAFFILVSAGRAQVFMRPFDNAAALALGGAVAAYPGLAAGLNNEALPGFGGQRGVYAGSAIPYGIGGWQTAHVQAFTNVDRFSGVGLDLAHSGIEVYNEQRIRLMYARRLGEKIYLGGALDALRVSALEYGKVASATFGLGLLAQALPKLWIGARIQNPLQQKLSGELLPSVLRIGACWKASEILMLLGEAEKDLERPTQIKMGVDYRPVSALALRVGVRSAPARVGFGAGLRLKSGLGVDFGSEWHPTLGFTPAAMLVWRPDSKPGNF
jgi:hypothetical protein